MYRITASEKKHKIFASFMSRHLSIDCFRNKEFCVLTRLLKNIYTRYFRYVKLKTKKFVFKIEWHDALKTKKKARAL